MKRHFCFLLVLFVSISIVGCGNASKNDSANTIEFETINNTETKAETESVSSVSEPEVATEVTEATAEPANSNYSGKLYTLPVGSASEVWTEAQLDDYLEDCKAFHSNYTVKDNGLIKVDLGKMMEDFGFQYVGTNAPEQENYTVYDAYWKEQNGVKMVACFLDNNWFLIYAESGSDSACVALHDISHPVEEDFVSINTESLKRLNKTNFLHAKGIAACLKATTDLSSFNLSRLPYASSYDLCLPENGSFNLKKQSDFSESKFVVFEEVYH